MFWGDMLKQQTFFKTQGPVISGFSGFGVGFADCLMMFINSFGQKPLQGTFFWDPRGSQNASEGSVVDPIDGTLFLSGLEPPIE